MVEHAMSRTTRISPAQQTLEVVARQHRHEIVDQSLQRPMHELIQQPMNRDRCVLPKGICEKVPGPVFELNSKTKDMGKPVEDR